MMPKVTFFCFLVSLFFFLHVNSYLIANSYPNLWLFQRHNLLSESGIGLRSRNINDCSERLVCETFIDESIEIETSNVESLDGNTNKNNDHNNNKKKENMKTENNFNENISIDDNNSDQIISLNLFEDTRIKDEYDDGIEDLKVSESISEIRCYSTRQLANVCRSIAKNVNRSYEARFNSFHNESITWSDIRRAYERPRVHRWSADKREEAKRVYLKNSLLKILAKYGIEASQLMRVLDINWDRLGGISSSIGLTIETDKQSVVIPIGENGQYKGDDEYREQEILDGNNIVDDNGNYINDYDHEGFLFPSLIFPPMDIITFVDSRWNICISEAVSQNLISEDLMRVLDDLEEILLHSPKILKQLDRRYGKRPTGTKSNNNRKNKNNINSKKINQINHNNRKVWHSNRHNDNNNGYKSWNNDDNVKNTIHKSYLGKELKRKVVNHNNSSASSNRDDEFEASPRKQKSFDEFKAEEASAMDWMSSIIASEND